MRSLLLLVPSSVFPSLAFLNPFSSESSMFLSLFFLLRARGTDDFPATVFPSRESQPPDVLDLVSCHSGGANQKSLFKSISELCAAARRSVAVSGQK